MWIISHPRAIQYIIANCLIKKILYYAHGVTKTEICQNILMKVSVSYLQIDILKKVYNGFPFHMMTFYLSVLVIPLFDCFSHHNC